MNFIFAKKFLFRPYMSEWTWPNGAENPSDWEKVTFKSSTGAQLTGLYSGSDGSSSGVIVCGHPMHPLAKGYFLKYGHATWLKQAGYDVFLFDFNGFGESEHKNFDFPSDIMAAVMQASYLSGREKVGYLGVSFGASWAISAMRYDHNIESAFLECPFPSLEVFCTNDPKACYALKVIRHIKPSSVKLLWPIMNANEVSGVKRIQLVYGKKDDITTPETGKRFMQYFDMEENYQSQQVDWFSFPTIAVDMNILPNTFHAKGYSSPSYFNLLTGFFSKSQSKAV